MKINRLSTILLVLLGLSLVLCIKLYFFGNECKLSETKYLNQNINCNVNVAVNKKAYVSLKQNLKNKIKESIKNKNITNASVYFRDLQDGPTMGINEYEKFSPASLLKLPMLLTYINISKDNPSILNTEIGFENIDDGFDQYYKSKIVAKPDTPYKIEDLLSYMITYSDNKSYYALREYLKQIDPSKDLLQQTFWDLGIIDPINVDDQTVSVKSYSYIFTQLYNNSFFSMEEDSEKALDMLSKSDFNYGLMIGVPDEVPIAHKFGERSDLPNGEKQLHDCGIVYYPENPYLLCVMTRGKDFNKLSEFIGTVSNMVYQEFDSRKL